MTRQYVWRAWSLWLVGLVTTSPAAVYQLLLAETTMARLALVTQTFGFLAIGLVGLLLSLRRRENAIGWLLLATWVYSGVFGIITVAAQWQQHHDVSYTGHDLATWAVNWGFVPALALTALYPLLLFPTGRVIDQRWQPLVPISVVVVALWAAAFAFQPSQYSDAFGHAIPDGNPYGLHLAIPILDALPYVLSVFFIGLVFAALVSLVLRYRRGDQTVRAQVRWFMLGGLCWLPVLLTPGDHGNGHLVDVWVGIAIAAVPVSMGVAILRYRLYDIDRIISRTASYAIVTGLLLATYAVIVISVTKLLPNSSTLAVAGATLTAAALARPLLQHVQHIVDRRFNRAHYNAEDALTAFGNRLRNEIHDDTVTATLTSAVHETLAPASVKLWRP